MRDALWFVRYDRPETSVLYQFATLIFTQDRFAVDFSAVGDSFATCNTIGHRGPKPPKAHKLLAQPTRGDLDVRLDVQRPLVRAVSSTTQESQL